jgi:poly(ADP-ribose) glycohydrolase ARH3
MRAAPVGLFFHADPDRAWAEAGLSARPTHVHPVGVEGAQLVALGTALALRGAGRPFDAAAFWAELQARAVTDEFLAALAYAANLGPQDPVSPLGHSLQAHRSVVTAIACFVQSPDSYEAVIGQAVALGGDCDTIAAMAGAISGARLGIRAVPSHLLELLEDGAEGRSFLFQLARRLAARAPSRPPMQDGPSP